MEINEKVILEQKLNESFKIAIFLHCIGLFILIFLFGFEPVGYKKMGLILSILALIISIIVSRSYFYFEKQLKEYRTTSSKSTVRKFNERFLLFYFPYTFWCSCIGMFL